MILADKIIDLRKKAGWSQEELAEKLGVSRQSVSKWEGAQSVPDMNKILQLSSLFNVSTDYLLKDSMEALEPDPAEPALQENSATFVSLEEANAFLAHKAKAAPRVALGVLLCILSPIALLLLGGAQETGRLALTESQGVMIGLIVLMLMVAAAVLQFVLTGMAGNKFEYLEKESLDTAYGVSGMVRERKQRDEGDHTRGIALGVVLCVLAVVPLFAILFWKEDDFFGALGVSVMLLLVGIGAYCMVRTGILWGAYQVLLEEGDYTREAKRNSRKYGGIYWGIVTATYLAVSFITMRWDRTWIIWPVAGVLYGVAAQVITVSQKGKRA